MEVQKHWLQLNIVLKTTMGFLIHPRLAFTKVLKVLQQTNIQISSNGSSIHGAHENWSTNYTMNRRDQTRDLLVLTQQP